MQDITCNAQAHCCTQQSVMILAQGYRKLNLNCNPALHSAQVRLADVVVLNKCDLATLPQVSRLEDDIHALVPDIRAVLRSRFGQVRSCVLSGRGDKTATVGATPCDKHSDTLP